MNMMMTIVVLNYYEFNHSIKINIYSHSNYVEICFSVSSNDIHQRINLVNLNLNVVSTVSVPRWSHLLRQM